MQQIQISMVFVYRALLQKIVLIISQEKKRSSDSVDTSTRPKHSKPSDGQSSRDVYPKECNLCNKYRIMRQAITTSKDAAEAEEAFL